MAKFSKVSIVAVIIAVVATMIVSGKQSTLAQGQPGQGFGRPSIDAQAFNACMTTDYASIAAKVLNITPAQLRKDIVAGQSLQEIAAAANVDFQTVGAALIDARNAEIAQAVKDGVLTQEEADAITVELATPSASGTAPASNPAAATAPAPVGTRPAGGGGGGFQRQAQFPDISTISFMLQQASGTQAAPGGGNFGGRGRGGGIGGGFAAINSGLFNMVKQYAVVAQAMNMKCADLVKTVITPPGISISALAAKQNVDVQTISDALDKAYKDALAQDVTDGVITQDQADQLGSTVDKTAQIFINNPLPMGQQGTPVATPAS